jgi:hypothetical protein
MSGSRRPATGRVARLLALAAAALALLLLAAAVLSPAAARAATIGLADQNAGAFVARFPQVRTYTTWNEANHESQPVASRPELVAGYYEQLRAACPTCTIVAGDVLDSGSYINWLQRFQAATDTDPRLWGLHNYGGVTYGTTEGTDAVLRAVSGSLWIEETGGIVVLRNGVRDTLHYDETRAAACIYRAFSILATRPRITRMYVYHWRSGATSRFDAGLARPDGSLRPSYAAMLRGIAGQPAADAAALDPARTHPRRPRAPPARRRCGSPSLRPEPAEIRRCVAQCGFG